ncbi:DUF417 family protein [Capnocytophaga sp.]|uniref:DUF417 family protein n=1 Tax=Capnocytophaga sp. TaxID=44737 RepID=UPI0026DDB45C|nr:DUF417 family protein [Capnocytophaga sp.]MDO5105909.1 DUF417 family protein [Capnocytophaga sp.]
MKSTQFCLFPQRKLFWAGYYISLFGTALLLLWIGIFKFTPTEAKAIEPLVKHHFLTFWAYEVFSVQQVSNLIGLIEIATAVGVLLTPKFPPLRKYVGIAMLVTFLVTLSYLFTTPKMWQVVDGVPVTDFFILKDLLLLGFGVMVLGNVEKNNANN